MQTEQTTINFQALKRLDPKGKIYIFNSSLSSLANQSVT